MKSILIKQLPRRRVVVRLTAVTFLMLLALIPLSPACLESMAASFMSLLFCQYLKVGVPRTVGAWDPVRLHEQHVVEEDL